MNIPNTILKCSLIVTFSMSNSATAQEQLHTFPQELTGTWHVMMSNEERDDYRFAGLCYPRRIVVRPTDVTIVRACPQEGPSVNKLRVEAILADRAFFSDRITDYFIITNEESVVFHPLDRNVKASVSLKLPITTGYAPEIELGVFIRQH